MLADCWLECGFVFFDCKILTKKLTDLSWAVDRLHGWRLPSVLSWSVVGWSVWAKRLTECGWLLVGGLVFLTSKSRLKWLTCLYWLHGWRLPSLLSWSVVGWLVLAKWLTECLADCWLVGGLVIFYCKIETKNWLTCLDQLTDCMAGGSPLCSAGRWLVNWFWKKTRLTECWLTVGWWVAWCFCTSKSRLKWLTCLDWLHGWRLPSLLSWSVVGWLVLAKRLTECWLLVGGWLGAFWLQNRDLNDWLVLTDCMAGGSPLCLAGRWLVDWFWQRDWHNVWLTVGWWVAWYLLQQNCD